MISRQEILLVSCCCIGLLLFVPPAHADELITAVTYVFFEQNGSPVTDPIHYTMDCYGYRKISGPTSYTTLKPSEAYTPEVVYSYSASCPSYGCAVYPQYYHLERFRIDRCEIRGETPEETFIIRNFSSKPFTQCYSIPHRFWRPEIESDRIYYDSPEYSACMRKKALLDHPETANRNWSIQQGFFTGCDQITDPGCADFIDGAGPLKATTFRYNKYINTSKLRMDITEFIQYLESCDPLTDEECGGWVADGTALKSVSGIRPYQDNATHLEQHPCDTFLYRISPSLIIPENEQPNAQCFYSCAIADQVCETRITLPSDSVILASATSPHDRALAGSHDNEKAHDPPLKIHRSPVESLYCSIVELLGGRCE